MSLLDKAAALVNRNHERYMEAEIHRVKGQTILKRAAVEHLTQAQAQRAYSENEQCFRGAGAIAAHTGAKMLQLRAAVSLSELLATCGRADEARQLLTESYSGFSEGFDVPDFKDARALLERLRETICSSGSSQRSAKFGAESPAILQLSPPERGTTPGRENP